MLATIQRNGWLVAIAIVAVVGAATLAQAAIPDGDGAIHGCYKTNSGDLRVVDDPESCGPSETALEWNQAGPQGPQGPKGDKGDTGSDASVHVYRAENHIEDFGDDSVPVVQINGLPAGNYVVWATATVTGDTETLGMTCTLRVNDGPIVIPVGYTAQYSGLHDTGFGQATMVDNVSVPAGGGTLFLRCGSADDSKSVSGQLTALKVGALN